MRSAPLPLWDWAVQAYARPGVAQACLTLQDQHGQSVPYLLWALRRAALGPPLDAADLAQAAALARSWEAAGLAALRAARRGFKPPAQGIDDIGRERLRETLKGAELAAERLLLEALERLDPVPCGDMTTPLAALRAACQAWASPCPPDSSLIGLASAFSAP